MTRLLRLVALLAYLFGGYLIGFMIDRLALIPVFAVAHVDKTFESVITIAAGVVGAISGLGWFNAKFALPSPRGGVHGSAHFALPRHPHARRSGRVSAMLNPPSNGDRR